MPEEWNTSVSTRPLLIITTTCKGSVLHCKACRHRAQGVESCVWAFHLPAFGSSQSPQAKRLAESYRHAGTMSIFAFSALSCCNICSLTADPLAVDLVSLISLASRNSPHHHCPTSLHAHYMA